MGFRQGSYAKLWSYDANDKYGIGNLSVSKKNKTTNKYEIEFQDGYIRFVGEAHTKAEALSLPTKDNFNSDKDKGEVIKITSCDVTNKYDKEKKKLYTNYVIFDFELPDNESSDDQHQNSSSESKEKSSGTSKKKTTKRIEEQDEDLPF